MTAFVRFLLCLSTAYAIEELDSNPLVGDGIDVDEAKAMGQSPFRMATSNNNNIVGTVEATELDNVYYAFRGIRYAKSPIGDKRFEEPEVLIDDWTQLESATDGPACPQRPKSGLSISEDCLWLNVFTPELSHLENPSLEAKYDVAKGLLHEHKFSKHAVMVFLHPTGPNWDAGWAGDDDYGPTHLLDYEVLLVTVNYRIGAFGFGNGKNLGLLDQVAALKWVRANVDRFGGDASKVTVIGHGTGGAAAHFHMLSSESTGLFNSVISMSGSALNWWALLDAERKAQLERSAKENFGSMQGLKGADANKLVEWSSTVRLGPTVDGKFLADLPERVIRSGKFQHSQWLVGLVSEEGAELAAKIPSKKAQNSNDVLGFDSPDWTAIRKAYFDKKLGGLDNLVSDSWYNSGVDKAVRLMAEYSKRAVYFYRLNQPNTTDPTSFSHGEELQYLFPMTLQTDQQDENREFRQVLLRMLSDFVRFGHPTVNAWNRQHVHRTYWRHFKPERHEFIELKVNGIKMMEDMYKERFQFWHNLLAARFSKTEL